MTKDSIKSWNGITKYLTVFFFFKKKITGARVRKSKLRVIDEMIKFRKQRPKIIIINQIEKMRVAMKFFFFFFFF